MSTKITRIIVLIILLVIIVFSYREPLTKAKTYFQSRFFPCSQPLTYSLGSIDPKFALSKDQALKDIQTATKLWDDAQGKNLFVYKETGGSITVNFIYDYRQQATEQLKSLGITINDDEGSYNSLKARYDSMQSEYNQQKSELDAMIASYNKDKANYDEQVAYWNSRGGAPKSEYAKLQAQATDLNNQANKIKQMEKSFNQLVDTINSLATVLNRLIAELNLKVNNYNNIGTQQGSEFEEGVFVSSVNNQEIDIYQFDNQAKLLRVLSHEFGHALGLGHVADPKAIMYRLNQGEEERLTPDDITALNQICSTKFNFSNFAKITP